jgi:hypothetical protein
MTQPSRNISRQPASRAKFIRALQLQDRGPHGERADSNRLFLPAGEPRRIGIALPAQPDLVEQGLLQSPPRVAGPGPQSAASMRQTPCPRVRVLKNSCGENDVATDRGAPAD